MITPQDAQAMADLINFLTPGVIGGAALLGIPACSYALTDSRFKTVQQLAASRPASRLAANIKLTALRVGEAALVAPSIFCAGKVAVHTATSYPGDFGKHVVGGVLAILLAAPAIASGIAQVHNIIEKEKADSKAELQNVVDLRLGRTSGFPKRLSR